MFAQPQPDTYLQLDAARRRDLLNEAEAYRLTRAAREATKEAQRSAHRRDSAAGLQASARDRSVKVLLAWLTR